MDKSINGCFEDIGMRLYNRRWSWGAQNDNLIVLRAKKTNIPLVTRGKSNCHRRRPQEFDLFASSSRTARQDPIAQSATSVRVVRFLQAFSNAYFKYRRSPILF